MLTQINLQTHFGGGEVYTAFLCRALDSLGVDTRLIIHPGATFWDSLSLPPNTTLVSANLSNLVQSITPQDRWLLGHGALPEALLDNRRLCTAIAHMPIQERSPAPYLNHNMIFPVSDWVRRGLLDAGLPTWKEPLYGVADLEKRDMNSTLKKSSRYDWDHRKVRDHLLGKIEPLIEPLLPHPEFSKRSGITLGIVSRLTPIKQFPILFSILSPILAKYPQVNIEIFGSGGYASVRDLDKAVQPIKERARFWGYQNNVATIYQQIDYLLTGLPEKEALGLNIIEAQACGTPVLAPQAMPFTETVLDGITGFFYDDPRTDGGKSFSALLEKLLTTKKLDPLQESNHLNKFSLGSFTKRIEPITMWAERELSR